MNKKMSNTESVETQYRSKLIADGKTGQNTRSENSHKNQTDKTNWMSGSCRSSDPENIYI